MVGVWIRYLGVHMLFNGRAYSGSGAQSLQCPQTPEAIALDPPWATLGTAIDWLTWLLIQNHCSLHEYLGHSLVFP